MSSRAVLTGLSRLLRGEATPRLDWRATIELANQAFLTPALAEVAGDAPGDTRAFIDEVSRRNLERNRRLRDQLEETATILHAAGIECTALKGAAQLAETPPERLPRLISDLDLLVDPAEADAAVSALVRAGFKLISVNRFADSHVAAELYRDEDVGMVDLHRRPPGPRHVLDQPEVAGAVRSVRLGGAPLLVPTPELQLLHLVLHDQLHDGDYWSGMLDLRHLHDTARLTRQEQGVDWSLFDRRLLGGFVLMLARRQFVAAHRLFGAEIPPGLLRGWAGRAQLWRSCAQMGRPRLRQLLAAGNLALSVPLAASHYRLEREWRRAAANPTPDAERRSGRLARLRDAFTATHGAKI